MKTAITVIVNLIIDYLKKLFSDFKMKIINEKIKNQEVKTNEAVTKAKKAADDFLSELATYDTKRDPSIVMRRDVIKVQRSSTSSKSGNTGTGKRTRIEKYKNRRTGKVNTARKKKQP